MSVTTPLTTLADSTATEAASTVANLTATLQAQDTGLSAARQAVAAATTTLTADLRTEASLRRQLCQIEMPADSDPLVVQLEAVLVVEQADRATVAKTADHLDAAVRARASSAAALSAATSRAASTAAAAAAEHASATQVEAWLAAIAATPVTDAIAAAAAARASTPYIKAQAHLKAIVDTPTSGTAKMFDLFARRATEAAAREAYVSEFAAHALDARQTLLATQAPLAGAQAKAETAYARAVAVLQDLAENAVNQLGAATASLAAIAAADDPTVAEQAAITVATDHAAAAAPHETDVYEANDALRAACKAFDLAVLQHRAADPHFDPDTAAGVATERAAVTNKKADVKAKVTALTADEQTHLDTYEATLPDAVKDQIVAFFAAAAIIAKIAAFGTHVAGDVGAAATALATARTNAGVQNAAAAGLDREVTDRSGAAAARATVSAARTAALIRGEGSTT